MTEKRNNASNVPTLRFPGFDEDWKSSSIGELLDFKVTNSLSREKLNYTDGTIKNIHYGDIHTKFQTLFDIQNEEVPFINNDVPLNKIHEESFCKVGDIVFADASEDLNDIGKSIEILNTENQKLLAGLHTLHGRPKPNVFYPGFVGYLFLSKKVRAQIQREAQGAKVLGISVGRISKVELNYPSIEEQKKISRLLSTIDARIQTQNKIIEQLESLIKGIEEKIFNQQIIFKSNRNKEFLKWEKKKLSEICREHQLKNNKNENNEVFSVAKHKGVINQIEHLGRSFSAKEISHYKLIYPGDLVYTKSPTSDFPFGIIKQNRTERIGVVSPLYCVFKPRTFALGYLIHEYFKSSVNTYNYLNPLVQKGAKNTMNINNEDFLNGAKLLLPMDEDEQSEVANFLILLDKKIELEKKILNQLKKKKKFLVANLFI